MALLAKIQETEFEKRLRLQSTPVAEPLACIHRQPTRHEIAAAQTSPCPACSSTRFWVDRYTRATHCLTCEPCPSPALAEFYFRIHVPGFPGVTIPGIAGELEPLGGNRGTDASHPDHPAQPIEQPPDEAEPFTEHLADEPDDWEGTEIDQSTIKPCPKCGQQHAWWNLLGEQRCMVCEPPRTSRRVIRLAALMRDKYQPDPRYKRQKVAEEVGG